MQYSIEVLICPVYGEEIRKKIMEHYRNLGLKWKNEMGIV